MQSIIRVIDANLNRSREGLRVCEDLARLVMNHAAITKNLKALRHELNIASLRLPFTARELAKARQSDSDIGRSWAIRDEAKVTWQSIMKANLKRTQESLRVLEECLKIVSPGHSSAFQKIRFDVYGLEKKIIATI